MDPAMSAQTIIISNLPPECDEAWLRSEAKEPERILSVDVLRPDDPEKFGVTLVVSFDGDRAYADTIVKRFHGTSVGGRTVRMYAPIFGS